MLQQDLPLTHVPADLPSAWGRYAAWRDALICAVVCIGCVLATVPFAEMGINDDWTYVHTVRELLSSGHLVYNGWSTAIVGIQAYWGALAGWIFGSSFTAVRLSMLPVDGVCAILLYLLFREAGVRGRLALFATLTVMLSPVSLLETASFMTDVPGLVFMLLLVYGYARALRSERRASALGWLVAATVAAWIGGTCRQAVWLAPLACLPYVAWRWRKQPAGWISAALAWVATAGWVWGCMRWFAAQPYSVPEQSVSMAWLLPRVPLALGNLGHLALTLCLLILPIFAAMAGFWVKVAKRHAVAALLVAGGMFGLLASEGLQGAFAPWSYNILTKWGIIAAGFDALGDRPVVLPRSLRIVLTGVTLICAALSLIAAAEWAWGQRRALRLWKRGDDHGPAAESAGTALRGEWDVLILLGLFSTAYLLAIVPRSAQDMAYDRYLIPVMPVVLIPILWAWQRQRRGVAVGGWIVLALFSGYAIATTHDHFASARARLRAATELRSAGVARQQITAGFEYDGWTELEISGHINDDRVRVPALAYQPVDREKAYGHLAFGYYFWPRTPSIDPRYFVVYSPQPGLVPAGRPPVHYRAWLPPFHRTVLMQRLPEAAPLASKAAP